MWLNLVHVESEQLMSWDWVEVWPIICLSGLPVCMRLDQSLRHARGFANAHVACIHPIDFVSHLVNMATGSKES